MYSESYNTEPAVAFEGQVADTSPAIILSRTVDADIAFGRAVEQGAKEHSVKAAAASSLGITVRSQATGARAATPDIYPANDTAGILVKGAIWVKVDSTVAAGDDVTLTTATGLFGTKAVAAGVIAVPGGVFETGAAANGLARIRIL